MENIFKRKITEIKIWIHGFNNRVDTAQEMIGTMSLFLFYF